MNVDAKTALIVVDSEVSSKKEVGRRQFVARGNIAALVATWQSYNLPVVYVTCGGPCAPAGQNDTHVVVSEGKWERKAPQRPRPRLEDKLKVRGIRKVVISGLANEDCASTIARITTDLGLESYLVSDADGEIEDAVSRSPSKAPMPDTQESTSIAVGTVDALVAVSTSMFMGP